MKVFASVPEWQNDLTTASVPMIYPHSYGWKHYSGITSASPSLVVFPPSKPQGIFAPYSQSFKHLSTAGLHSSISLALTVLAGYISALPGKKVQCFVSILSLERILLYLPSFSLLLMSSLRTPFHNLWPVLFGRSAYPIGPCWPYNPWILHVVCLPAAYPPLIRLFFISHSSWLVLIFPLIFSTLSQQ